MCNYTEMVWTYCIKSSEWLAPFLVTLIYPFCNPHLSFFPRLKIYFELLCEEKKANIHDTLNM